MYIEWNVLRLLWSVITPRRVGPPFESEWYAEVKHGGPSSDMWPWAKCILLSPPCLLESYLPTWILTYLFKGTLCHVVYNVGKEREMDKTDLLDSSVFSVSLTSSRQDCNFTRDSTSICSQHVLTTSVLFSVHLVALNRQMKKYFGPNLLNRPLYCFPWKFSLPSYCGTNCSMFEVDVFLIS